MSTEAKCSCQKCGEHIAFPSEAAGQAIECPHCQSETILSIELSETNQIVNCLCQHCGGEIEFDSCNLTEENKLVQCPHCGLETKLVLNPAAGNPDFEDPDKDDALQQQKADFLETVQAGRAERYAQLKQLEESSDNMAVFSNQDTLKLHGDCITIQKRGLANMLASGMNGERTIQISSLTAVQMKPAGMVTRGYILFSYAGSKPFNGGILEATRDPDAFLFFKDSNGQIAEFKAKVEKKMRDLKQRASPNNFSGTLTDELRKLAEFKSQGILSQAEFDAAKKKLLS